MSSSPSERSLVLVKPDAVRRGLIGEILSRFEGKGLVIEALVLRTMDAALADRHYADHVEKPPLKEFMTSGPLVALVLSGDEAVEVVRAMVGATDGRKAAAGTIRGDLSLSNRENLVHASDSPAKPRPGAWASRALTAAALLPGVVAFHANRARLRMSRAQSSRNSLYARAQSTAAYASGTPRFQPSGRFAATCTTGASHAIV